MKKTAKGAKKAAGLAEQVKHKLGGDYGILNTLAKEHGEVSAALALVRTVQPRDPHASDEKVMDRVRILADLALDLVSHAQVEEEQVYAALEPHAPELIRKEKGEHRRMEELLHQLLSIEYSSPRRTKVLDELRDLVASHVEEEEDELFAVAKQHLSKDELKAMDRRFQAERRTRREELAAGAFALPRGG